MKYKDYIGYNKTYIIVHNTGFGVMEAPFRECEIIYETNNYKEAASKCSELKIVNNSPEAIASNWCYNTYWINVNTLTCKGKRFLKEFKEKTEATIANMKLDSNYRGTVDSLGNNWHEVVNSNNPFFEQPAPDNKPLISPSTHFLDMSKMRIRYSGPKNEE